MGGRDLIVLDTHVWLWWVDGTKSLPRPAKVAIDRADILGVPAICLWEVVMLVEKGRLELGLDLNTWLARSLALPGVELLALSPDIAVATSQLGPGFHGDPADRLVAATALRAGVSLVTADRRLRECPLIQTVWD